jgi:hypothetical protein
MSDHFTSTLLTLYRIAHFVTLNLVDDAAILSLMFC